MVDCRWDGPPHPFSWHHEYSDERDWWVAAGRIGDWRVLCHLYRIFFVLHDLQPHVVSPDFVGPKDTSGFFPDRCVEDLLIVWREIQEESDPQWR